MLVEDMMMLIHAAAMSVVQIYVAAGERRSAARRKSQRGPSPITAERQLREASVPRFIGAYEEARAFDEKSAANSSR